MIQLVGGPLYQWETGREVAVIPAAEAVQEIHFANTGDSYAIPVVIDGTKAKIPDKLLQTGRALVAYEVRIVGNDEQTVYSKTFPVKYRQKPKDYIYSEAELALSELKKITAAALEAAQKAEAAANVMVVYYDEVEASASVGAADICAHFHKGGNVYLQMEDGYRYSLLSCTDDVAVFVGWASHGNTVDADVLELIFCDKSKAVTNHLIWYHRFAEIDDKTTGKNVTWSSAKIQQMLDNSSCLVVTHDGNTASHTAGDIFAHLIAGGQVILQDEEYGYMPLVYACEDYVGFAGCTYEELFVKSVYICGDGSVEKYDNYLISVTELASLRWMKVTLPDDMSVGFASHNAGEIAKHVSGGGAVILYDPAKDRYLPLQDVSRDDYIARAFAYNAETKELESYEVYDDGTANYFVRKIVDEVDLKAALFDDTTIGESAWSSKNTVDRLCPDFTESGRLAQCRPVDGYPLTVTTKLPPFSGGYEQLILTQNGKNLFPSPITVGSHGKYIQWKNGGYSDWGSSAYASDFIPCEHLRGLTVTINHTMGIDYNPGTNAGLAFYSDKPASPTTTAATALYISGTNEPTFTVPDNAKYMATTVYYKFENEMQLELGNSSTDFEVYTEKTHKIAFDNLGIAVGGGEYNWNTGALIVTHTINADGEITELSVPQVFQLEPQQITAQAGVNTLYANIGDTEVRGRSDPKTIIENQQATIDNVLQRLSALESAAVNNT